MLSTTGMPFRPRSRHASDGAQPPQSGRAAGTEASTHPPRARTASSHQRPRRGASGGLLHGPLPVLPAPVDAALEGWWRLPPRVRAVATLVGVGLVIFGILQRTSTSEFGPPEVVAVARTAGAAGMPVEFELQRRPQTFVPPNAVREVDQRVLARDIGAGEVVTEWHLAAGVDSLLTDDEVALAVPDDLPDLPPHARLFILATGLDGTGVQLGDARLLTHRPDWLWIALDRDLAPAVTAAMDRGGVTIVLAPP